MPEARICEIRLYWAPTSPSRFSHCGLFGSAGRLERIDARCGRRRTTCRNGTAARPRRRTAGWCASRGPSRRPGICRYPSQLPREPLSFRHFSASKRGLGNLRKPERAGRGPESQVAGILPLIDRAVRRPGVEWRVFEVAGRVAVAFLADELQEFRVARAPLEAVGLVGRFAGHLSSPGMQQSGSGIAPQAWNRSRLFLAARIWYQSIAAPIRCGYE